MDQKISQFYSSAENQSTTLATNLFLPHFGRSWLELEDSDLQCAKLRLQSFDLKNLQGTHEFCGVLETTGSDGYFMINCSIRPKSDADENAQDGPMAIVDCKCLVEISIADRETDFYAKGLFHSQIHKGKESTASVRFMAKEFLEKVSSMSIWHMHIAIKVQLTTIPSTQWRSLGTACPVWGMEPPFSAALRSKVFADVNIECGVSTVFARMLASSKEKSSTKTLKIDDQDPSTIERMLDFLYNGNFTALSFNALVDQLYCAEKYDLQDLKAAASVHMVLTISDFNVMKFFDAAVKCNVSRDVIDKLIRHCKSNFEVLSTMGGFKEFFAKNFDEFFCSHRGINHSVRKSS